MLAGGSHSNVTLLLVTDTTVKFCGGDGAAILGEINVKIITQVVIRSRYIVKKLTSFHNVSSQPWINSDYILLNAALVKP